MWAQKSILLSLGMHAPQENLSRAAVLTEQNTHGFAMFGVDFSEICSKHMLIAAKPGYVESWLILQIKAEFKSIDLHHFLV